MGKYRGKQGRPTLTSEQGRLQGVLEIAKLSRIGPVEGVCCGTCCGEQTFPVRVDAGRRIEDSFVEPFVAVKSLLRAIGPWGLGGEALAGRRAIGLQNRGQQFLGGKSRRGGGRVCENRREKISLLTAPPTLSDW